MVFRVVSILGLALVIAAFLFLNQSNPDSIVTENSPDQNLSLSPTPALHPMSIISLRQKSYPGSDIKIEETLSPGSNYDRYIASYVSEGNKINGLLTVPKGSPPQSGYPLIVFIHGYIAPNVYRTTERYVAYQDGLARNGFITYKIDLRGHANSEGEAVTGHYSEAYVVDTLNAISSLKKHPSANPEKIGLWGHSNGGEIGLRSMVVNPEIDVGIFWAGVVGSFKDMLETYNDKIPFLNLKRSTPALVQQYGLPSQNPEFWNQIDPYSYLGDIDGAIQLHHGTADNSVPIELSRELQKAMEAKGKTVELFQYPGADHNLSGSVFTPAMQRTIDFFKTHL